MSCLYIITHKPTGRQYIGQTKGTAERRWRGHVKDARRGSDTDLHRSIREFGEHEFTVDTLLIAEAKHLDELEISAISIYQTRSPRGFNMGRGGEGVDFTPEVRRKMSAAYTPERRAHAARLGVNKSPDHMKNLRQSLTGRRLSSAHREAISASLKGRPKTAEQVERMRQRTLSEDHKAAISAAQTGRVPSKEAREKMRRAKIGRKRSPRSEEHRKRLSEAQKEKTLSEEHRAKLRQAWQRRKARAAV